MRDVNDQPPVALAHPSLFTKVEIDLYERLLASPATTERDASEFFSRFPRFLWLGDGADIRREVVLLGDRESAAYRVDFFRRRYGKRFWDIIELKSPQQPFAVGSRGLHPRLSTAVNSAINQALDYRDQIVENGSLRESLKNKGIFVYRPQILVIVGKGAEIGLPPERLQALYDRARQGPIEAMSYSDILEFAKEHYAANCQIVLPAIHYRLPTPDEVIPIMLEELRNVFGFSGGILYLIDTSQRELRLRAFFGLGEVDNDIRDFSYSLDEPSIATKVIRERKPYLCISPAQDLNISKASLRTFAIDGSVLGLPIVIGPVNLGALIVWARDRSVVPEDVLRLQPFVNRMARVLSSPRFEAAR